MKIDKAKWVCLVAFTALAVSGCGKSSSTDEVVVAETDPLIVVDDPVDAEVTPTTEATDGIATPVVAVSSAQMDAFVTNPLVAEIPAELNGGSSTAVSRGYVTNPLIN